MKRIVASVKLTPGTRGYFDPLTGINLSRSNSVGYVRENDNVNNIRKAIREGKIKIVGGQLPPAVSIKPKKAVEPVKASAIKGKKMQFTEIPMPEPKKVEPKKEEVKPVVIEKKEEKIEVKKEEKKVLPVQKMVQKKKEEPKKTEIKEEPKKEEVKVEEPVKEAEKKVGE